MSRTRQPIRIVIFSVLWSLTASAQVTTGTISGIVRDTTGAVIPSARIVVQNEDTGISRTLSADSAGRYSAPSLGLGNYRVTASADGFQTEVRRGIVLTVGREAVVNLQLNVGAVAQSVEVTGEAPLVQTTEAAVSYLVDERTVRDLPLNGRDLTQLILLNPGVNVATNGTTGSAFNGWGMKISIGGTRSEDSSYFLDGTYINDMNHHIPAGPSGALLGVETVREFQVLTNSFGAQYGRTLGGVFNAVSKSGTNELHGNLYEFLRNSAFDARDFFDRQLFPSDPRLPPFRRNQFGGALGGPVLKDRTFFFVAYEGMRERLSKTQINVVPDENARRGILPTGNVTVASSVAAYLNYPIFPLPSSQGRNFGDGTAQYIFTAPQPTRDDFGQARIDHQFSSNDSLFGRFTGSNSFRSRVVSYPEFLQLQQMEVRLFTLSETHIFSPRMLNNARLSFNRVLPADDAVYPSVPANLLSVPGQPPPTITPGSGITGWSGYGTPGDYWATNRFALNEDLNLTLGTHALQFGGLLERMQLNQNFPNRPFGVWGFSSLTNFLRGIASTYRGTPPQFGSSVRGLRQWFYALYLQDDWKVSPKLTLNLGLRWEPYSVPTEVNGLIANQRNLMDPANTVGDPLWINHSWTDFGPRFGFAWSPFSSAKTSVRGATALVFSPNDQVLYRDILVRLPALFPEFRSPTTGHFPDAIAEINAIRAQGSFGTTQAIVYEKLRTSRALQYNLSLQQQIGSSNMLAIGYTGLRGMNHMTIQNYNNPLAFFNGVSLEVPANATVFNPNFTSILYEATNANSWYNALTLFFQRRFSAGFQAQVSYTWSKSLSVSDHAEGADYSGSGGGALEYVHDIGVQKGLSGFHVAHTLSTNYSYILPFGRGMSGLTGRLLSGWQLQGIVKAQTGQPFSVSSAASTFLSNLSYTCCAANRVLGYSMDEIIKGGPDQYFNPQAFSAPGPRELGNGGRNTLIGPGMATWDFGITKDTGLTERWSLQFRAELFNLLNRANFGLPASNVFTSSGSRVGSAGSIRRTVTTSRQAQLSLKLLF